jgi:hypothetical protein
MTDQPNPSAAEPPDSAKKRAPGSGLVAGAPAWITAIAALVTALVGAAVLLMPRGSQDAEVRTESVTHLDGRLEARGAYFNVDQGRWDVVLMVRPESDPSARWALVQANTTRTRQEGGLEDGTWEASVPSTANVRVVPAIVSAIPGGGFSGEEMDRIREAGPDADVVVARGDAVLVAGPGSPSPRSSPTSAG